MLRSVASLSTLLVTYTEEEGKFVAGASRSATPTPIFTPTVTKYTIKVPHKCSKIDVTAFAPQPLHVTPLPSRAKPAGKGKVTIQGNCDSLRIGKNVITVTATSDDGSDTRVYTLKVMRRRSPVFYFFTRAAIVLFPLATIGLGPIKLKGCCEESEKKAKDAAAGEGDGKKKAAAPAGA